MNTFYYNRLIFVLRAQECQQQKWLATRPAIFHRLQQLQDPFTVDPFASCSAEDLLQLESLFLSDGSRWGHARLRSCILCSTGSGVTLTSAESRTFCEYKCSRLHLVEFLSQLLKAGLSVGTNGVVYILDNKCTHNVLWYSLSIHCIVLPNSTHHCRNHRPYLFFPFALTAGCLQGTDIHKLGKPTHALSS